MPAPPSNDKTSNLPPVYRIPVSARTVNGESESEDYPWSDDSESFAEGPSTDNPTGFGPRELEPNSTGTARLRPFPHDNNPFAPSGRPRAHARRQIEPTRNHQLPSSSAASAWPRNYEDGPRMDHAYSSAGDAWYPFGAGSYRGEHVVPYYNYNSFPPPGAAPGPPPSMPAGPTPPIPQHPMNTGPGMYHGYGIPPPPPSSYGNMHPTMHPTMHPNQHPNQHPQQHLGQHPHQRPNQPQSHFQMPPPYPSYPPIDVGAPPPRIRQPRVNIRRSSTREDQQPQPRPTPPPPYADPSEPFPRRTRGRQEATPRKYEQQRSHPRPQPPHGRRPRPHRPSTTEKLASDSEGPQLSKENLEKLEGAEAYMKAANKAGMRPGEKAREQEAKMEQKKEPQTEAQHGENPKSAETKDEKTTGVVEDRIKNIEDSLQQLVTAFQGTALHTTTAARVPGLAQDPFRTLRDLESRQLMHQVSSLLQSLSGGLGVGFAPPVVAISPLSGLTPMINSQQLGSLLRPQYTSTPGHPLNNHPDELTALYVQQLQQKIERLERERDASTPSKAETGSEHMQQQAAAGGMKDFSALEYLKVLNEGMHHLNARLGASQEKDHIRDADEVASTTGTTATTDSGTAFETGRRQRQRRPTATRENVPGEGVPVTTESRPGIMKPTHRRSASRASSSSKKARFEDDISDQEDEDDLASYSASVNYTYKSSLPSSSPHHQHQPKGQTITTPPSNMNIKTTRSGTHGGVSSSSSYPPRHEDLFDSDDGTAESRGLRRKPMKYAKKGLDISDSTWKPPVVPDPPPANL
ncbi:hypothetical protein QBC37DRAFT_433100 [Rhypophila decipiens]|uniref:Uncharacterized protein n=1 Tax=Rhypophila decipiens TaxID=261697 RepID=A0AAN6XY02_9PEZI|nr:hypothetical protein QBC37DRAFT_433100 [Rhypophila decipiens]